MSRQDLTDEQWAVIEPLIPKKTSRRGRPRNDDRRPLTGTLYMLKAGCAWEDLPRAYGSASTCWRRLNEWSLGGTWERLELVKAEGIWLDADNHFDSGQVCIGNTSDHETALRYIDGQKGRYAYLPNAGLLFPALLEPEPEASPQPEPERSCAELVAAREQDLLINDWMATIASQYIYKLLHRQPITSFVSYVSADGMSVRSVPICREELDMLRCTPLSRQQNGEFMSGFISFPEIDGCGCLVVECLMQAPIVVEVQIGGQAAANRPARSVNVVKHAV